MKKQKELSACCKAPVTIEHDCDSYTGHLGPCTCSDGITIWYECSKCHNACNSLSNLDISFCPHCYSMTKTIDARCGKCKKDKSQSNEPELCQHGLPMFQSCDRCDRIMVHDPFCKYHKNGNCTCAGRVYPNKKPSVKENFTTEPEQAKSWEKEFDKKFYFNDDGDVYDHISREEVKLFISTLLQKKEAEHKKERNKVVEAAMRQIDLMAEDELRDIEKLKQQHRAELEGLIKFIKDQPGRTDREVIMIQISKLLNSKEGE